MTVVRISRSKLIDILKKETNLEAGAWITSLKTELEEANTPLAELNSGCTVCAVGSVFRNIISPVSKVGRVRNKINGLLGKHQYMSSGEPRYFNLQARTLLKKGFPMNALSVVFEGYCEWYNGYPSILYTDLSVKRARERTIRFIRNYFPRSIKIDIDGLKPAKDIKVVSNDNR